jgi:hypothetical protein
VAPLDAWGFVTNLVRFFLEIIKCFINLNLFAIIDYLGWMTGENFFKSLQHFKSHVNCSKKKPVLLTMDNHTSHLDYRAVQFAKENGIVLLPFPPHCSHALQPLDVCVFGPFKSYLSKNHNEWLRLNPGKRITIKEVAN